MYNYDITNKKPKFKIDDLVRISLKRRALFDKPTGNITWSEQLYKIYKINVSNFFYRITFLWNSLPRDVRTISSTHSFKSQVKQFLWKNAQTNSETYQT